MPKLKNDLMSISAFSKLSRVPRKTLIFYDQIGLFKPAFVAANGYRYYTRSQFDTIGVIYIFKELGMSLEDIREYLERRSPVSTLALLRKQEEVVQLQIAKLTLARQMITQRADNIEHSLNVDTSRRVVIHQERKPLLRSYRVHESRRELNEELWDDFQERLQKENAPAGYPAGAIIGKEDLLRRDGDMISYMFSFLTTQHHEQEYMPEGYYLVSYTRADYEDTERIYPQIFEYMEKHHYVVKGDAYEEFLQDEVVMKHPEDYLVRVMVHIEEPAKS
ncbi:MerR family transcriptional regulator [Paenibacillus silagei]|uniref:DNA-binding transcriptional MerR regulator n=1 Tax=Paenibacillus silagei TaxID=1670801 RepID=A0ABS4NRS6_9BACL|nr:MerR family transcriptional regulator [Paenibacillus silagei]MBP2112753.1 DNA-binding transcriptional MerR regulator [Paenibacillus silagei]